MSTPSRGSRSDQPRGQPGNSGQFAAKDRPPAAPPGDIAARPSPDPDLSPQGEAPKWEVVCVEDGRPGTVHDRPVGAGYATASEAAGAIAGDLSRAGQNLDAADVFEVAGAELVAAGAELTDTEMQSRWFAHNDVTHCSWLVRIEQLR